MSEAAETDDVCSNPGIVTSLSNARRPVLCVGTSKQKQAANELLDTKGEDKGFENGDP